MYTLLEEQATRLAEEDFPIETDEQEKNYSEDTSDGNDLESVEAYELDVREDKKSVFEYLRLEKQGRLIIDPDYQRQFVWKAEQKSRFIESLLLNIPTPAIYLNQQRDGKYVVIDGLQRTLTLKGFMNSQFALNNLNTLTHLNGKTAKELPNGLLARLEDRNLLMYVVRPSVPIRVVYDLFNRINTGGTPLNRQEIRNGLLIGKSTELLKDLSQQEYFIRAIDKGVSDTRMKDREVILRYLAFKIFGYDTHYNGDLSGFLDKTMLNINKMNEQEIAILQQDFQRVMQLCSQLFGNRSFRYPILNEDGSFKSRGFFNTAIFESICYCISSKTDDFLLQNQQNIASQYDQLLQNPTYKKAVRSATGNKQSVLDRFRLVEEYFSKTNLSHIS